MVGRALWRSSRRFVHREGTAEEHPHLGRASGAVWVASGRSACVTLASSQRSTLPGSLSALKGSGQRLRWLAVLHQPQLCGQMQGPAGLGVAEVGS